MKTYSFAKVSARGYLTQADYNNKYIITEDLKMIINVSGRDFEKPAEYFQERGIATKFLPLTEKNGDMGYHKILEAVKNLLYWDKQGGKVYSLLRIRSQSQPNCYRSVPLRQDGIPYR